MESELQFSHRRDGNARIQRVRAGDSTQVKTADRALRCNPLFVDCIKAIAVVSTDSGRLRRQRNQSCLHQHSIRRVYFEVAIDQ